MKFNTWMWAMWAINTCGILFVVAAVFVQGRTVEGIQESLATTMKAVSTLQDFHLPETDLR